MKIKAWLFVLIGALVCLVVLVAGISMLRIRSLLLEQEAGRLYAPPVVYLTHPDMGMDIPVGSHLTAASATVDRLGIKQIELWMDGSLVEKKNPGEAGRSNPYYANFDLLIPDEGTHVIMMRAVNTSGVIDDSLPVQVMGTKKPDQVNLAVKLQAGQSLEDIADKYQTSLDDIIKANPGQTKPGTILIIPRPPSKPASAQPQTPVPIIKNQAPIVPNTPMLQQVKSIFPVMVPGNFTFSMPKMVLIKNDLVPPDAPTDLQASVDGCNITLMWNDNADNESYYEVNSLWGGMIARLQSNNGKSKAWYRFQATEPGKMWLSVAAINAVGKAQSNSMEVGADKALCTAYPSQDDKIEVEAVTFKVTSNVDRYYCYVRFNQWDNFRIPANKNEFIDATSTPGAIAVYASGKNKLVAPKPINSLTINGQCLGWGKDALKDMGSFSQAFPASDWDGSDKKIKVGNNELTIRLRPYQKPDAPGIFGFDDPSLPAPFHLSQKMFSDQFFNDPYAEYDYFWKRKLSWDWAGDAKNISGFILYLNGKPFATLQGGDQRSTVVTLPAACDMHLSWQVAAQGSQTISNLSIPMEEELTVCTEGVTVVEVKIDGFYFDNTWDYDEDFGSPNNNCNPIETYAEIFANGQVRQIQGGNFFTPVVCNQNYDMADYAYLYEGKYKPAPNIFKLYFPTIKEKGGKSGKYPIDVKFGARMWDHDDVTSDDLASSFYWSAYWENYEVVPDEYKKDNCWTAKGEITDVSSSSTWWYCVKVYQEK